ncbi:hypothetical protein C0J52_28261 [Blattella germanica]|nr:hypothetical protein C0J52_28261 [Blattella germanica]
MLSGEYDDTHADSSPDGNDKLDVPEHDIETQNNEENVDDHDSSLEHHDDQNEHAETSSTEQANLNVNEESNDDDTEGKDDDTKHKVIESKESVDVEFQSEDKHHEDSGEAIEKEAERESHSILDEVDDISTETSSNTDTKKDLHSGEIVKENDNANEDTVEDETDDIDSGVIVDKVDNNNQGEPAHLEIAPDSGVQLGEGSGSEEHISNVDSKDSDELKTENLEHHSEELDDEEGGANISNDASKSQDSEKDNDDGDKLDAAVNFHDNSHELDNEDNIVENNDSNNQYEGTSLEDAEENHKAVEFDDDEEDNTSDKTVEEIVSNEHKTQSGEDGVGSLHVMDKDSMEDNTEEHDELNEHPEVTSLEKEEKDNDETHESNENDSNAHEVGASLPIDINTNDNNESDEEHSKKLYENDDEDESDEVDKITPHEDKDNISEDNEEQNGSIIEEKDDKSVKSQENENEMDGSVGSVAISHDIEKDESVNGNDNNASSDDDDKDDISNQNDDKEVKDESEGNFDDISNPFVNESNELEEEGNENDSANEHSLKKNYSQEEDGLDNLSVHDDSNADKELQETEEKSNKDNSSQEKDDESNVTEDSILAVDPSLLTDHDISTSQQSEEHDEEDKEKENGSEGAVNGELSHNFDNDEDEEHSDDKDSSISHDKEEENDGVGSVNIPFGSDDGSSQEKENEDENKTSEHHDEDTNASQGDKDIVSNTSVIHDENDDDEEYEYEDEDDDENHHAREEQNESNEDAVHSVPIPPETEENKLEENEENKDEEEPFISSKHHEVNEEFVLHTNVDSNEDINKYENGDHNETLGRRFNEDDTDVLEPVPRRQELYEDNGKDQKDTLQDFFATLLAPSRNDSESHSTIQTDNHKVTLLPLEPFEEDETELTTKGKEENIFWVESGNNEKEKDDDYLVVTKVPLEPHDIDEGSGSGEPITENPVERTDSKLYNAVFPIPNEQGETTEKIQEQINTAIEQSEVGSGNSHSAGNQNEDLVLPPSKKNTAEQSKVGGVNEVGVGEDSVDPNAESQQSSTGSYVVLGVIMVIIVALLGYSVLRSRRRRQAAKPEEDFGTEMKDVEKTLLPPSGNGNVRTSQHPEGNDDEDESKTKLLSPMNIEDGDSKPVDIVVNGGDMKFNDMVTIENQNEAETASESADIPASTMSSAPPNVHYERVIEIGKNKSPTQMARERFFNMNSFQQNSTLNEEDRISGSENGKTTPHNGLVNGNSDGSAFVNGHVLDDMPSSKVKVVEKMDEDSILKKPVFVNNDKNGIPC